MNDIPISFPREHLIRGEHTQEIKFGNIRIACSESNSICDNMPIFFFINDKAQIWGGIKVIIDNNIMSNCT